MEEEYEAQKIKYIINELNNDKVQAFVEDNDLDVDIDSYQKQLSDQ